MTTGNYSNVVIVYAMPMTFIRDAGIHLASFIRCVNFRSLLNRVQIVKFRIFQSRHAATFSSFSFLRIVTLCVFLYRHILHLLHRHMLCWFITN